MTEPQMCLPRGAGTTWPAIAFLVALVVALLVAAGAAQAQRIAAVVNEDVVTDRDVTQRARLAMMATGRAPNDAALGELRSQMLRGLVDERLQLQEAQRLGIEVPEADVDAAFEQVARANNLSPEQLRDSLERVGIEPATLRRQIRAQLAWRGVVRRQLVPRVIISDVQVAQRLREINAGEPEFRLQEIFLPIYEETDQRRVVQDALRLRQELAGGADFAALARQFSAAPSAERGGDLGWLAAASLPEELRRLIEELPDGGITRPIRTREGIYLLRRLDARAGGAAIEVSLLRLDLADPSDVAGQNAETFVAAARAAASSCDELAEFAGATEGVRVERLRSVAAGELEGQIATAALTAPEGVVSEPLRTTDGGTALLMVCDRRGGAGEEQRQEVVERLRGEALERLAQRYLRNLRRDAFIELRPRQG